MRPGSAHATLLRDEALQEDRSAALVSRRTLLSAMAGSAFATGARAAPTPPWLEPPPRLPDVSLIDHEGRSRSLLALAADQPLALSFFYTGCSAVCPPQTAMFRQLQSILAARHAGGLLLSISLDPLSDSPEAIRAYAARFGARLGLEARWLMLGGSALSLARVRSAFDAGTGRIEDHQSTLWAGSPSRGRWARTSGMADPELLARWMGSSVAS